MFLSLQGSAVHLRVEGPSGAPTLLMLHSLGTDHRVWDAQAAAFSGSMRVVRPDMRGHGLSAATPGPYVVDELAADALAVLDALGVASAHVAGISIGGLIAQALALRAADRVASLVLCDTALAIPPADDWHGRAALVRRDGIAAIADAVLARWVTPAFAASPEALGLRAMLLRTPPEGYAGAAEAIASADLAGRAGDIAVPTLVLVGEADTATPLASAEALRDAIPKAQLEVVPGAHIPTMEYPEAVTDAMRRFYAGGQSDTYAAGMAVRRQVLGEAHVARATAATTDLDRDFQEYITRAAWGGVWTRPHLDRRTRSMLTLALMAALGHHEEFRLHVRASRNTGATTEDIGEVLIQVAAYAGIPAANAAMRVAKETLREMDA